MSNVIKFPLTAFERLLAARKRKVVALNEAEVYRGERAALARIDTEQAREIAQRLSVWLAHNAELSAIGLNAALPPGWHFEMIHGKKPTTKEDRDFWYKMHGGSNAFRIGFTRGLLRALAKALRSE